MTLTYVERAYQSHVNHNQRLLHSNEFKTPQQSPSRLGDRIPAVAIVAAAVLCRLEYGNGTLHGRPPGLYLVRRLQSMQNAAAQLVFRLGRSDHIMDALDRQPPLAVSAYIAHFQDRRADLSGYPYRAMPRSRPLSTAIHTDRLHPVIPVSTKTAVFFIRRSTCFCYQTNYHWSSRLPRRRRSYRHMERPRGLPVDVTSAPSLFIFVKQLNSILA